MGTDSGHSLVKIIVFPKSCPKHCFKKYLYIQGFQTLLQLPISLLGKLRHVVNKPDIFRAQSFVWSLPHVWNQSSLGGGTEGALRPSLCSSGSRTTAACLQSGFLFVVWFSILIISLEGKYECSEMSCFGRMGFFLCLLHTHTVLMVLCIYLKDSMMEGMCVAYINLLTRINSFRRKVCICVSTF